MITLKLLLEIRISNYKSVILLINQVVRIDWFIGNLIRKILNGNSNLYNNNYNLLAIITYQYNLNDLFPTHYKVVFFNITNDLVLIN